MNSRPRRFQSLPGMDFQAIRRPWVFFANRAKENSIRRQLAERLSNVEFVISIETPISAIRKPWHLFFGKRIVLNPSHAVQYYPFHHPERIPGVRHWLRRQNHRRLIRELKVVWGIPPFAVFYDSPTQWDLVGKFGERWSLYLAVDDRTLKVTGESIPGEELAERRLLERIDGVICVSANLAERLRRRSPDPLRTPIHVLPNGYDERFFQAAHIRPEPAPLKNVPRPRLLIHGHISERIDWEGITEACQMRPSWNWVFLGPADPGIPGKIIRQLRAQGHYFPPIPVQQVPAWIQHCEACAAPYRLNSFTLASDPLKVIESLAMGTPVLATRIPSLGRYQGVIIWVEEGNGASYGRALDLCEKPDESGKQVRQKAVLGETWQVRAEELRAVIWDWENRRRSEPNPCALDGLIDLGLIPRGQECFLNR
jgi:glycosyltransferase involved in cell wall biosynthesis